MGDAGMNLAEHVAEHRATLDRRRENARSCHLARPNAHMGIPDMRICQRAHDHDRIGHSRYDLDAVISCGNYHELAGTSRK